MRAAIYRLGTPHNNVPTVEFADNEALYEDEKAICKRLAELECDPALRLRLASPPVWIICVDNSYTLVARNAELI